MAGSRSSARAADRDPAPQRGGVDRRTFLRRSLGAAGVLAAPVALTGCSLPFTGGSSESVEFPVEGPEEALQRLIEGNLRFANGQSKPINESANRRAQIVAKQRPFSMIFSCVDSRVPPELIFDRGLGDLFVIRTAGEVVDHAVLGSLEYGAYELEIPLLLVLGHKQCGAVKATLEAVQSGGAAEGDIGYLVEALRPAVSGRPSNFALYERPVGDEAEAPAAAEHPAAAPATVPAPAAPVAAAPAPAEPAPAPAEPATAPPEQPAPASEVPAPAVAHLKRAHAAIPASLRLPTQAAHAAEPAAAPATTPATTPATAPAATATTVPEGESLAARVQAAVDAATPSSTEAPAQTSTGEAGAADTTVEHASESAREAASVHAAETAVASEGASSESAPSEETVTEEVITEAPADTTTAGEATADGSDPLTEAIKRNVELVVEKLSASAIIAERIKKERLLVVGAIYDLETGLVELTANVPASFLPQGAAAAKG